MRRNRAKIRDIIPDARYHDVLVARFINYLMLNGKKSVVEKAVYQAFDMLEEKLGLKKSDKKGNNNSSGGFPESAGKGNQYRTVIDVFKECVDRVTPRIEVRSKRVGGATYQVPCEVSERRGTALALKWLTFAVRKQAGKGLHNKIFKVLTDVLNNTGWAYKKKEEVFRMAEANKAFAHFNW